MTELAVVLVGEGSVDNCCSSRLHMETESSTAVGTVVRSTTVTGAIGSEVSVICGYLPSLLHPSHPDDLLATDFRPELYCSPALSGKGPCRDITLCW